MEGHTQPINKRDFKDWKDEVKNFSISMFDNSTIPFCVIHVELNKKKKPVDWTYLYCNQAFVLLEKKYTREELLGHRFFELFPKGNQKWLEYYYRAAYKKESIDFDSISEEIGQELHIDCIPMEKPGLCACMVRNTWKEREYKRQLESQIISFQNIHEALVSGPWNLKFNKEWRLASVTWSDTLRKMLGFESVEDFPNTFEAWSDRLHPEDKARTLKEYILTVGDRSGKKIFDVEYRIRSKDEKYHWFRAAGSVSRREDGSPDSFDGVFINRDEKYISDKKYQNALKDAQDARNEAIADYEVISSISRLYFSIYGIDLEHDIYEEIFSNDLMRQYEGHKGKAQKKMYELCNQIVAEEYRESVRHFFDLSTVAQRLSDADTVEMEYYAVDGNWHEARFIEKKRNTEGRVTNVLYATRVVSKEKQQELEQERLRIAYEAAENANEAKTTFLLNMSHDIRTPMNAIMGYTQLMKKHIADPELLHYQEMIEQSGNLLLSIINNVLDMARIESGKTELDENYDDAGSILKEICQVFAIEAEKKEITLVYELYMDNLHIMCDAIKIKEIFTNLISNAIKYTPSGGQVTVSAQEIACEKEGYICIKTVVEDTGIGMSAEFLPHLFESFSRERNTTIGKVGGTGLGMAIIKSLVELMEGTIEVESELGKGSKFTVIIPHKLADKNYYVRQVEIAEEEAVEFEGKHILLAEDNDLNAEISIIILNEMGFIVDRVEDGIVCVDRLEKAATDEYDLILMDIQMPNMDGYKATQVIRHLPDKRKASIPIIAMTANAFAEDRKKAFEEGMNEHIAKPIDVAKIKEVLSKIIKMDKKSNNGKSE